MSDLSRYLTPQVKKDLHRKMVFVAGPRQVGKTTMAFQVLGASHSGYMNWDIPEDRERIFLKNLV